MLLFLNFFDIGFILLKGGNIIFLFCILIKFNEEVGVFYFDVLGNVKLLYLLF